MDVGTGTLHANTTAVQCIVATIRSLDIELDIRTVLTHDASRIGEGRGKGQMYPLDEDMSQTKESFHGLYCDHARLERKCTVCKKAALEERELRKRNALASELTSSPATRRTALADR